MLFSMKELAKLSEINLAKDAKTEGYAEGFTEGKADERENIISVLIQNIRTKKENDQLTVRIVELWQFCRIHAVVK